MCQHSPAEGNASHKINALDYSWSLQSRFPQFILVKFPANALLKHVVLRNTFIVPNDKHLHCATSRTVSGSIPGDVTGDFFP